MKRSQEGSITVFLSLIFLLILAVIMTTIETARVNVAKVYTERALTTAMDSVLAEYYLPLFEEYHIFALESGYGTESIQTDAIVTKMEDYMEYTFEPNKDLYLIDNYIPINNVNLLGIHTTNLEIEQTNSIMDYNGELFADQAVSYMKYKELGNGLESFLQKKSIIKDTTVAQTVLTEKQIAEESLYKIDQGILGLMSLVDGISISEKGVKTDKQGKILIKDNFIKRICILPATMDNLGIENQLVFSSLSGHHINPLEIIDLARDEIDLLIVNISLKDSARIRYRFLSLIDQSEIESDRKLEEHKRDLKNAKKRLRYYEDREVKLLNTLNKDLNSINELVNGTLTMIGRALPILDNLILKQGAVTQQIEAYESILFESQKYLNEGLFEGLSDDLTAMEKYKKTGTEINQAVGNYDFQVMKDTLLKNQSILLNIRSYSRVSASEEILKEIKSSLSADRIGIQQYSHRGLQFDYSTLTKPVESEDFFHCLNSMLENGIIGLVVDETENISKKKMTATNLPTSLHNISESIEPKDISSSLSNIDIESEIGGALTGIITGFGTDFDLPGTASASGEALGRMLLLQEYIMEHFDCYNEAEAEDSLKALNYELEYIVMGRNTDYNNLKGIIMKIMLIRTVMNVITLMGDSKSCGEARALAISFVGFTGLPALVSIIKTIILSIWAFAESLIDIAAILQGKSVPLLKNGSSIQLELQELFLINHSYIKNKVAAMKENTAFIELNYRDYLRLFLFVKKQEEKSFRSMDLIQENLQNKYEDTFYIKNCLFGYRVNAEYQMNTKFVTLPFVKQFIDYEDNNYIFHSTKEYSY